MSFNFFQKQLEEHAGTKLKLKINDNHSTMLSVRWEPGCPRVSLNRIFLQAPQNVMEALACYIKQEHKQMAPTVKEFIRDNLNASDFSQQIDLTKLSHQGKVYNLQHIYEELNRDYFLNTINGLSLTWFGKHEQRNRSRITFGLYHHHLKLIKIHRILDNTTIPDYIIDFVIFHEMLHHVCPAYVDEKGFQVIHSKEFKEKETKYMHYELAQKWIRQNQVNLFL